MATAVTQQSDLPQIEKLDIVAESVASDSATVPPSNTTEADLELPLSATDGVVSKPFGKPLDSAHPVERPPLTAEQSTKYATLLERVKAWTEIPTGLAAKSPKEPLTDGDRMFLTRECLLRYLRATKWHIDQAETRLRETLSWRREYGIEKHTADYISPEQETGKQVITGFDINGRPCLYLFPSRQNTERTPRQIHHLVYDLERLVDLMPPGQETCALLINFNETKSGQGATLSQGRETMYILQNHYPERLGRALVTQLPWYIKGFFTLITPFIDPNTREKIKFNEDMTKHVPAVQLLKECGGEVEMKYDHSQYWPALNALAELKRTAYKERWVQAGKQIGEHEDYLRGGNGAKSLLESENLDADADADAKPSDVEAEKLASLDT